MCLYDQVQLRDEQILNRTNLCSGLFKAEVQQMLHKREEMEGPLKSIFSCEFTPYCPSWFHW